MGFIFILVFLAAYYAFMVLVAWVIMAILCSFGVPVPMSEAHVYLGGLLLFILTAVCGGFKITFKR